MTTEAEAGATWPRARECREPPGARGGREQRPIPPSPGSRPPLRPARLAFGFSPPELKDNGVVSSHRNTSLQTYAQVPRPPLLSPMILSSVPQTSTGLLLARPSPGGWGNVASGSLQEAGEW